MDITQQFQYNIQCEGKFNKFQQKTAFINLNFKLSQKTQQIIQTLNLNQHILIVLDQSGSMSGNPIEASKQGIIEMVTFFSEKRLKNITLIPYESYAKIIQFNDLALDKQIDQINKISGTGGTSFKNAFNAIIKSITQKKSKDVKVIFFTDGQDYSAAAALIQFKKFFVDFPKAQFHTIGFRQNHDAQLLGNITKVGNMPGTFQYCKGSYQMKKCVQSVTGLVGCSSIEAKLVIEKQQIPLQLQDVVSDSDKIQRYKTILFINPQKLNNKLLIKFSSGQSQKYTQIDLNKLVNNQNESTSETMIKLLYIKTTISQLLQKALNLSKQASINKQLLKQLILSVQQNDKGLDLLGQQAAKLKGKEKKQFYPQLFQVKQLINEFYGKLKDFQSGQINNDKIASLNALAYRKITKKGLQKKLDVRTQKNIEVINNVYDNVKKNCEKIDFKNMQEKYKDLSIKLGNCMYSANNFIEALKDEDCLCLTFDLSRSQAAIMDPSQITIKQVFPTYLTVSSFLFSAQYALKNDQLAHGGFSKKIQGSIIKGIARQDITGVLPLYICEQNWIIAKQLIKPALGWTVTLDPLGYSFSQVKIVPCLILAKLYNDNFKNKSEHTDFQIKLVEQTYIEILKTAVQINKDANGVVTKTKLTDDIIRLFNQYIQKPIVRTIDSIAHNQVFLVQIYLISKMKLIELPGKQTLQTFFNYIYEQELRRQTKGYDQTVKINELMFSLLNINVEKYVNIPYQQYIEKLKKSQNENQVKEQKISEFKQKMLNKLEALNISLKQEIKEKQMSNVQQIIQKKQKGLQQKKINSKPQTQKSIYQIQLKTNGNYNPTQKAAFQQLQKIRGYARKVTNLRYLFGLDVTDIPIQVNSQNQHFYLTLYIQNKLNAKNSDRRDSITNNTYINPFTDAKSYITKFYIKFAEEQKLKKINQYNAKIIGNKNSQQAIAFAQSTDIIQAAGMIDGISIGAQIKFYYEAICSPGIPLFKQKLNLLIKGNYKGIKLYRDTSSWGICRNKSNKILRIHFKQLSIQQWLNSGCNLSKTYLGILEKQNL